RMGYHALDPLDQALHVVVEIRVGADPMGMAVGQIPQTLRELLGRRDRGTPHQHGGDRELATQGGLDLDPDEVAAATAPAGPARPGDRKPFVPDAGEEDIAAGDTLGQDLAEIQPQGDRIDVLEDSPPTIMPRKVVVEPPRLVEAILSPIGDEDADL